MELQVSRYNLYFPAAENDLTLIYNTLTEGTMLVSESGLQALRTSPSGIPLPQQEQLARAGVVVPAGTDEQQMFRQRHQQIKHSTQALYVMLYTTYACNLACTYCYEGFLSQTSDLKQRMSPKTARAAARLVKRLWSDHHFREVRLFFFGGEPMLHPDPILSTLQDLTPWAASNDVMLSSAICTNGTVPLGRSLPELVKYGTFLHFTLDGPKPVHDARRLRRGGQGTFDDIIQNISLAGRAGVDFAIRVNVDKTNAPHVETLLSQLRTSLGEGLKMRFAEVIPPVGETGGSGSCAWANQCLMGSDPGLLVSLVKSARDMGMTVVTRPLRDWVFCEFLTEHSYIVDPFGDIYKCEGLAGMKAHRAGVLKDDGSIETTPVFDDWVSRDPVETDCGECVYLPACGGGCPCLTLEEKGTYHSGGCTMFKGLLHAFIEYTLDSTYPGLLRAR